MNLKRDWRIDIGVLAMVAAALARGSQPAACGQRLPAGSHRLTASRTAPRTADPPAHGERAGFDDTMPVTLSFIPTGSPKSVTVAGTFNSWNKRATKLVRRTVGLAWTATLRLAPGVYQYKFIVNDTRWIAPQDAPRVDDGHGNINAVLTVAPPDFAQRPALLGDGRITPSAVEHRVEAASPTTTVRGIRFVRRVGRAAVELTLRTRRSDVQTCWLILTPGPGRQRPQRVTMTIRASDTLFDYWHASVPLPAGAHRIRYAFALRDGTSERVYDRTQTLWEATHPMAEFVLNTEDYPPFDTPEWARDAIFYQIFPDRFANGDKTNDPPNAPPWGSAERLGDWHGGDLAGVRDHLEYLRDLGINALYFNPIFKARSVHAYDTTDYKKVDPRFGDLATLKAITSRAHLHGWHVILDGVFNHTGVDFKPFKSVIAEGAKSQYKKWYFVKGYPVKVEDKESKYESWNGTPWMPKLNVSNPQTREYLLDVATYWIRQAKIDGWRLDAANEVAHDYWKKFRRTVKKEDPNALILGEIWTEADDWLQGDEMDTVTNYPWRGAVLDFFAFESSSPTQFDTALSGIRCGYPAEASDIMFNLLGSHDTERIRTLCGGDWGKQRQAVVFQMTYPGVPVIYYGDEIGMDGGKDPDNRRCMEWDASKWDKTRLDFYKAAIALRKGHAVLRRGDYTTVAMDDSKGIYAFLRTNRAERALVVFNRSGTPGQASIPISKIGSKQWKVWLDTSSKMEWQGNNLVVSLPEHGFAVMGN
ncbi:MAG TPA: alpha amylase N-terminal ig-like domain-containing protein [Chthonomonadaceae bacterium]|nr:alpha amylase N-terminal ig-like domain-containing protein [Chthonomonadaceae bacterium]